MWQPLLISSLVIVISWLWVWRYEKNNLSDKNISNLGAPRNG